MTDLVFKLLEIHTSFMGTRLIDQNTASIKYYYHFYFWAAESFEADNLQQAITSIWFPIPAYDQQQIHLNFPWMGCIFVFSKVNVLRAFIYESLRFKKFFENYHYSDENRLLFLSSIQFFQ